MQIYVLRDNESTGPFGEDEIRSRFIVGSVTGATMVWWEGLPEWQPLGQTDWGAATGIRMPPPANAGPVVRRLSNQGRHKAAPRTAVASMVMGICSFMALFLGSLPEPLAGIAGLMGLFLAIAAVVTGHMARHTNEKYNPLDRPGNGLAIGGLVLGYIILGLFAIAIPTVLSSSRAVHQEMPPVIPPSPTPSGQ